MPASVDITWHWIDFDPAESKKKLRQSILTAGANKTQLDRGVYVIRLKSPFGIAYPKGHSPTLYIGEGDVPSRLEKHREWINRFQSLGYAFPIEVACTFPRVRKNEFAYKNFEAHLLSVFFKRYGTLPLKNSIHETRRYDHQYSTVSTQGIIGPGRGTKHTWSIQPLAANSFRKVFQRTHSI